MHPKLFYFASLSYVLLTIWASTSCRIRLPRVFVAIELDDTQAELIKSPKDILKYLH
jgi:hypothetical protein